MMHHENNNTLQGWADIIMNNKDTEAPARSYKDHLREQITNAEEATGYLSACYAEGPETFALAVKDVWEFARVDPPAAPTEKCPVCKNDVPLNSLLSYNNIPNATCPTCAGESPAPDEALEACPPDLIAFKWAETLSTGEQSVLLTSSLKRLQTMIDSRASVAAPPPDVEKQFLDASVAVWREIDRLSALPEGYKGLPPETDPRKRELAAWEAYRKVLDNGSASSPVAVTVDAERLPFSLDDVVQQLNRVLGLLESIEDHSGKMSVQEPLPKARVILRGLIGHCALQATARHYSCSCGGALTAEEYIEHYFEKGHDHGDLPTLIRAAAAEIQQRFLPASCTATGAIDDRAELVAILSKRLGAAAVGEHAELQRRLFDECVTANWDPERKNTFAEEIAHLHEELSEAFRAWRKYKDCEVREVNGKLEGVPIEFADVVIGLFYNAELHGFNLLEAVERKHEFNLKRNYVAEGRQLHAAATPTSTEEGKEQG